MIRKVKFGMCKGGLFFFEGKIRIWFQSETERMKAPW